MSPVTLMVARRVAHGRYQDFIAWLREGEHLATDFPGYLGSGVLAPPPSDNEFQIVFRFSDEQTMAAWEHSASRQAWLKRGSGLFAQPQERRAVGLDAWFGNTHRQPPRWKQTIAIWLAFFPVSLGFNLLLGPSLIDLSMVLRVLISTLLLTPLMTYLFIPLVTRLLAPWLQAEHSHLPATRQGIPGKP